MEKNAEVYNICGKRGNSSDLLANLKRQMQKRRNFSSLNLNETCRF
jgi:hypothetical protein